MVELEDLKQAIVNTSAPSEIEDFSVRIGGTGLVQADAATKTVAVAFGRSDKSTLSFGFDYDFHDMHETALMLVRNHGSTPITFNLSTELPQGAPHSISFERASLTVPAFGHASTNVTLNVPIHTVGNADDFRDVGGIVKLTPTGDGNSGIALRLPYYLVARALSNVQASLTAPLTPTHPTSQVRLTNPGGPIDGTADFYDWGLVANEPLSRDGKPFQLRSAGVQSFDLGGGERAVVFALSTRGRMASAAPYEFDVILQNRTTGDLFAVFNFDVGSVTAGDANGVPGTFVLNLKTGDLFFDFNTVAPNNGNTILLPVLASTIGVTEANPRFDYGVVGFDYLSDGQDALPGTASFNAFNSAISNADFFSVPVGSNSLVAGGVERRRGGHHPVQGPDDRDARQQHRWWRAGRAAAGDDAGRCPSTRGGRVQSGQRSPIRAA